MGRAPAKPKRNQRTVEIRKPDGGVRHVGLYQDDFRLLAKAAEGGIRIKGAEKLFAPLYDNGLIRYGFDYDAAGFPHAIAKLTPDGAQALAQEFTPETVTA